jgi:3-ketosteroid 9alpha-monooxygenase subunit A
MAAHALAMPNGWFQIAFSEDLAPGALLPIHVFGQELVLFRGEDGEAAVVEAYCAHLGAHLGHGGRVEGNRLRCPFHGWCYDAKGECLEIPYARRIPPRARIRSWPVEERNGQVYVWHHAGGEPPSFRIPQIAEYGAAEWTSTWTRYSWELRTHPQEMMENAIDWPHFEQVHAMDVPSHRECSFEGPMFRWVIDAGYENEVGGPSRELYLVAENWGLGFNTIHYNGAFETRSIGTITPIDEGLVRFTNSVIGRKGSRSEQEALAELRTQMDEQQHITSQDFAIWENKTYRPTPVLCDGDGPIGEYRRWARQFYGPSSAGAGGD